ncbi:MAG: PaaI family thioesterase [Firmicutes bacterium]|nr:PaaI family thioesterase [Bacillota bacterium]
MCETNERKKHKVIARERRDKGFVSGTGTVSCLNCTFYVLENGDVATYFTLDEGHQGWKGIAHGGVSYSVLDEVMGRSNRVYDDFNHVPYVPVVTGEISCRYIRPVPIGERIYAYGRVDSVEGRKWFTSAELVTEDGTVIQRAKGIFFEKPGVSESNYVDGLSPTREGDPEEL